MPTDVPSLEPSRILDALVASEGEDQALVHSVCELAISPDPTTRARGQQILFATVAESLGDAFDERAVTVHDRVLSSAIEFCRQRADMRWLDERLRAFGVANRSECLARKAALSRVAPIDPDERARIRKVFVLSRVTLGADVAVTSVVLQAAAHLFPQAERCLLAPRGTLQLLAGLAGTTGIPVEYDRRGLLERLRSWGDVADILEREATGLDDDGCLVIDPDSRFTQLGLLPIVSPTAPYLFFESRAWRAAGLDTLGEITAHWLRGVLPGNRDEPVWPAVTLAPDDAARAQTIVQALRGEGGRRVAAMNAGVGGNARKRIPGSFELQLVRGVLAAGCRLVIDHGAGEDEARVAAIVAALRSEGRLVADVHGSRFKEAPMPPAGCDVVAYRGPVGPFAALAGACDVYAGYDSAFQHIAAAQGVPVVDIFVDPPNPIFPMRWRPHSTAAVTTVIATAAPGDSSRTLATVLEAVQRVCRVAG